MYYSATAQGAFLGGHTPHAQLDLRQYQPGEPLPRAPSFMYRGPAPNTIEPDGEGGLQGAVTSGNNNNNNNNGNNDSQRKLKVLITPSKKKVVGFESSTSP